MTDESAAVAPARPHNHVCREVAPCETQNVTFVIAGTDRERNTPLSLYDSARNHFCHVLPDDLAMLPAARTLTPALLGEVIGTIRIDAGGDYPALVRQADELLRVSGVTGGGRLRIARFIVTASRTAQQS